MALLNSLYIPNWYVIEYFNVNTNSYYKVVCERFSTKVEQAVSDRQLIQGDAGTHVFDVNGTTWSTTLSSDLLIFKDGNRDGFFVRDIFDLLIYDFNQLRNKLTYPNLVELYNQNLLSSATVNIGKNLTCNLTYNNYYQDKFGLTPVTIAVDASNIDFVARTAKFYDTRFYVDGYNYLIQSGSMSMKIDYRKMYLFNTSSSEPFYSPESYSVSGNLTIAINDNDFNSMYVNNQTFLSLFPKFANVSLLVDNRYLSLGQASLLISNEIKIEGQLIIATVSFKTYARKI
jgi:hypothetical protein